MTKAESSVLPNAFEFEPAPFERVETDFRRIVTSIPAPQSLARLRAACNVFPQVNCYQAPVIWDRAEGFQVHDEHGNRWIDFSSTAVMCNTGHGHPHIREALARHVKDGLLAQFSFASDIRIQLAERLLEIAPSGMEKVYFWTTGSEAMESALRIARVWGIRKSPKKSVVCCLRDDYHGCTLGATQLSGASAAKSWLPTPDPGLVHLRFPHTDPLKSDATDVDWDSWFAESLRESEVRSEHVAAIFLETMQGWRALALPKQFVQAVRRWADAHQVLLVFDEIQTGFCRTGKWFGHEHYEVRPDLICVGKGISSTLPLAAVLGPAEVLDTLTPGEVTTTHAGHPLSCAAALANLEVMENEHLAEAAASKGEIVKRELMKLQERFPRHIHKVSGLGLLWAIHLSRADSGEPDGELARDFVFEAVRRGVMFFHTNRPTVKICPPLVIPTAALADGLAALGEAFDRLLVNSNESKLL